MIALIAVIFLHDRVIGVEHGAADAGWRDAVYSMSLIGGITLIAAVRIHLAGRRLTRTGRASAVVTADRVMALTPLLIIGAHCHNILLWNWLTVVRNTVGDLVFVDEALATLPAILALILLWWMYYPIERRIREVMLIRFLDQARPVQPIPTRREYVGLQIRHQLLLTLIPLSLIMIWVETLPFLLDARMAGWLSPVLQLAGIVAIFVVSPVIIRYAWDTVPLPPGELRDRLVGLCGRHRARVRQLLIWRTHGGMINGAVMGMIGRLRYVLLTDGLIEAMSDVHVEAVMAHEIGHIKRRHLPTLMALLMICVAGASVIFEYVSAVMWWMAHWWFVPSELTDLMTEPVREVGVTAAAFIVGLLAFGYVSRRFERQADTFAVQHLSQSPEGAAGDEPAVVTGEAVATMAGALGLVATLNHIPPDRRSWRHGSIRWRQRYLRSIVGLRCDKLRIDRQILIFKIIAGVGVLVLVALILVDLFMSGA
ncbi:MAG: M48 family metalloprotease [Phycisphaerales bacterium]|nr:M48 family metalloprotease [Phycisphaerales bacterium]